MQYHAGKFKQRQICIFQIYYLLKCEMVKCQLKNLTYWKVQYLASRQFHCTCYLYYLLWQAENTFVIMKKLLMSTLDLRLSIFDDLQTNFKLTLRNIEMANRHTNIQNWMKTIQVVAVVGVAAVVVVDAVVDAVVICVVAVMTAETGHIVKSIANFEMKVISYFCSSYSLSEN